MTTQQLESFIEEMEKRAKGFEQCNDLLDKTTRLYWDGKATEARFVIDRIKQIMEK